MANFDSVGLQYKGYTHTTPGIMSIGEHTSRRVRRGGGGACPGGGRGGPSPMGGGGYPTSYITRSKLERGGPFTSLNLSCHN